MEDIYLVWHEVYEDIDYHCTEFYGVFSTLEKALIKQNNEVKEILENHDYGTDDFDDRHYFVIKEKIDNVEYIQGIERKFFDDDSSYDKIEIHKIKIDDFNICL